MKKNNLGSSETIREASSHHPFQAYVPYMPQHRKFDQTFLEWFVGFAEGDGNFQAWYQDNGQLRFRFCITQADKTLLATLRTQLGYGTLVAITANDGMIYYQLRLETRQNVLAMVHLFTGNLRLEKVQKRFQDWAEKVCKRFQTPMPSNPQGLANRPISLTDAWLSGFFQADGGFAAQYRTDRRRSRGYRVEIKVYIDQKGELPRLEEIASLLGGTVTCRNEKRKMYRARIGKLSGFETLVDYLTRFPLRGRKHIAQSRWFRVVNYLNTYPLPHPGTKSYDRFVRLVRHVNACQTRVPPELKTSVFDTGSIDIKQKKTKN